MSTPIETNTEELREILQQVYSLPDAASSGQTGSDKYDLIIDTAIGAFSMNGTNTYTPESFIVSKGDLVNVWRKVQDGERVCACLRIGIQYGYDVYRAVYENLIITTESTTTEDNVIWANSPYHDNRGVYPVYLTIIANLEESEGSIKLIADENTIDNNMFSECTYDAFPEYDLIIKYQHDNSTNPYNVVDTNILSMNYVSIEKGGWGDVNSKLTAYKRPKIGVIGDYYYNGARWRSFSEPYIVRQAGGTTSPQTIVSKLWDNLDIEIEFEYVNRLWSISSVFLRAN